MKKLLSILLIISMVCFLFAGCSNDNSSSTVSTDSTSTPDNASPAKTDFTLTDDDMFTKRDSNTDYDKKKSVTIKLKGNTATASSDSVLITDSKITITEEATYIISGTLDDGMIVVDAPDTAKLQLVLNGVDITSKTSAALYIIEADKVFVTLATDKSNTLSNGGNFTAIDNNNIDAAVFSKQDLTFNGLGSLTVNSPAGHGVVCKDDLVFTGGTYEIGSASHGLDANDSVRITGKTNLNIDAGKDGIHCENSDDISLGFIYTSGGTINVEAEGDGISAGYYMQIEDGTFNLLAGGGSVNGTKSSSDNFGGFKGGKRPGEPPADTTTEENSTSMKGIKSSNSMMIRGGSFSINSADDSIHSDISVTIEGGNYKIASGDDAVHAEELLTITDGTLNITESYEGLEALTININGGDIKLVASDDGLNAAGGTDSSGSTGGRDGMFDKRGGKGGGPSQTNGSIAISGGKLYVNASGDGLDSNGSLNITGGNITVVGPSHGDTSTLDYETSATISGGTFIGTGAVSMAQTFSETHQGILAVSTPEQAANTSITLTDKDGNIVISHKPELSFSAVILSSPKIITGQTYTITIGSTSSDFVAS